MNPNSLNLKILIGITYLVIIATGLYFLFSFVDIKDLTSYEFIRANKNIILEYKKENFLFLTFIFFIFSIVWVLLLGFASPLLLFSGFVFGKWWGILIILISTTIGASILYLLAGYFFKDIVEKKLAIKFVRLKEIITKNEMFYFMVYRFIGGAGTPYAIQNILPVLFNMKLKNYILATLIGCMPSMFITVAIGSGVESVIDKNEDPSFISVISSPEIYLPIFGFFIILILGYFIKKKYFEI